MCVDTPIYLAGILSSYFISRTYLRPCNSNWKSEHQIGHSFSKINGSKWNELLTSNPWLVGHYIKHCSFSGYNPTIQPLEGCHFGLLLDIKRAKKLTSKSIMQCKLLLLLLISCESLTSSSKNTPPCHIQRPILHTFKEIILWLNKACGENRSVCMK